jgi:hypothetical protein
MSQVLHLDAGKLRQGVGESFRAMAVRNLDRQLVHGPGAVSLEDVDTDKVPPEFPDPRGDLAQRSWSVREPQSDDDIAKHGLTISIKCERTISAMRTLEEPDTSIRREALRTNPRRWARDEPGHRRIAFAAG